jgi:hypothetical protein
LPIVGDYKSASPYLSVAADLRLPQPFGSRAHFVGVRSPHIGSKGNLMVYQIVVHRSDSEIDTLYWNGSLEETMNLARKIGVKCEADRFRVIELAGCGAEARSEDAPFLSNCYARGALSRQR